MKKKNKNLKIAVLIQAKLVQKSPSLCYSVLTGGLPPSEHTSQRLQPLADSANQMPIRCWFSSMPVCWTGSCAHRLKVGRFLPNQLFFLFFGRVLQA